MTFLSKKNAVLFLVFCIVVGLLVYFLFLNKKGSTSLPAKTSSPLGYNDTAGAVKDCKKESVVVKDTLPEYVPAGSSILPIDNAEAKGFKIGQKIKIGHGPFTEVRIIVGFGSINLNLPTKYEHRLNETVVASDDSDFNELCGGADCVLFDLCPRDCLSWEPKR